MKKLIAAPSSSAAKWPAKPEPPADDADVVSEETEEVPVNNEVSEESPDDGDGATTEQDADPRKRPAAMPNSKKGATQLDGPGRSFMDRVSKGSPSD